MATLTRIAVRAACEGTTATCPSGLLGQRVVSFVPQLAAGLQSPVQAVALRSDGLRKFGGVLGSLDGISRRLYSSRVRSPLRPEKFYNRSREIEGLRQVLDGDPSVTLLSGPVNSGKTSLMLHVLEEIEHDRPVLHIDLRAGSFNSVEDFAKRFSKDLTSWSRSLLALAKKIKFDFEAEGVTFSPNFDGVFESESAVDKLNNLLEEMDAALPPFSWWEGKLAPVLFIDEASRFNALTTTDEGMQALRSLFEWFIQNTKQNQRFHVILGSSDSFFHLWVQKYVGSSRFASFVIGDLTHGEAQKFWTDMLAKDFDQSITAASFEDAYGVCGGNMYLLKRYCHEHMLTKGKLSPRGFQLVTFEKAKFDSALQNANDSPKTSKDKARPWSREELLGVMRIIIEAKPGFVSYSGLIDRYGEEVVDSMIRENLLHLRPTTNFSFDLVDAPIEGFVVTPETKASLEAMKMILESRPSE